MPHTRGFYRSVGLTECRVLYGVAVLGRLLQYFVICLHWLALSPWLTQVPPLLLPDHVWGGNLWQSEQTCSWGLAYLGAHIAFSSMGHSYRGIPRNTLLTGATSCVPVSTKDSSFFLSSSFQKQAVSFLALSKK